MGWDILVATESMVVSTKAHGLDLVCNGVHYGYYYYVKGKWDVPLGDSHSTTRGRERERILNLYTAASKQIVLRRGATGRRRVSYLGKTKVLCITSICGTAMYVVLLGILGGDSGCVWLETWSNRYERILERRERGYGVGVVLKILQEGQGRCCFWRADGSSFQRQSSSANFFVIIHTTDFF